MESHLFEEMVGITPSTEGEDLPDGNHEFYLRVESSQREFGDRLRGVGCFW